MILNNPPCKKCHKPMMRWGWYEEPVEAIEYWYCPHCDLIQTLRTRWHGLARPIEVIRHDEFELFEKLRQVRLRGYDNMPYRKAKFSLGPMTHALPCQWYVLTDNLLRLKNLREMLYSCFDVDILYLKGYVTLVYKNDYKTDILPPIIEANRMQDCDLTPLICDGMHRLYLARLERATPRIVYITDVDPHYPYYAYPNINGWNDVQRVVYVPGSAEKKWHRFYNYRDYYRDFNTVFNNVGDSRVPGC